MTTLRAEPPKLVVMPRTPGTRGVFEVRPTEERRGEAEVNRDPPGPPCTDLTPAGYIAFVYYI
jgi:hypothetical protein